MPPIERGTPSSERSVLAPEIRGLKQADFPQIHDILYANLSAAYRTQFPGQDPDRCLIEVAEYTKNMAETFAHNRRTYLVAERNGIVVGTLGCIHDSQRMRERLALCPDLNQQANSPNTVAELINFYVKPEIQRKGIGRGLWDGMRMTLAVGGAPDLVTLSSRDIWEVAHAFYLQQDFCEFGTGSYYDFPTTYFYKNGIDF